LSTKYQGKQKGKQTPAQQRPQASAQQRQQNQQNQQATQGQQIKQAARPAANTQTLAAQEAARKEARVQRQAQERAQALQRKRQANVRKYAIMSAAVLVVVAVIAWVMLRDAGKPGQGQAIMTDRTHLQAVTDSHVPYSTDPPTSGPHTQDVPAFKVYTEPLAKELQVHGLEDGAVVINYQPDLDKPTVDKLTALANLYINTPGKQRIIMSPYPGLSNPIVLTTWGRMDRLDTLDETRIRAFVDAYVNIDHHENSDGQRLP
jgi:hypothetical protein